MTAPMEAGINILLAVQTHAEPDADTCDREADELERLAHLKRVEAFRLRALARAGWSNVA